MTTTTTTKKSKRWKQQQQCNLICHTLTVHTQADIWSSSSTICCARFRNTNTHTINDRQRFAVLVHNPYTNNAATEYSIFKITTNISQNIIVFNIDYYLCYLFSALICCRSKLIVWTDSIKICWCYKLTKPKK